MKKKIIFITFFILCITLIFVTILYRYNIIPHKMYTNEYFKIETYKSKIDKDLDGIDDETDILNSVREYLKKKPKYKSKYYASGYPDDEFGVCTDVVAFGLLGAGYDLMELVYQDVLENKEEYDIDVIDKKIDFRRVLNLNTYFKRHAISLTTNIYEISSWQGGDIVVFPRHIGIVSDKRNKDGIPFVIHHKNPYQIRYEEDILEKKGKEIIGHYRIS